MLWKGVYPYECMNSWERFSRTSLPEKKEFNGNLTMEDITDVVNMQEKFPRISEYITRQHHDLYVQSDRLLLVDLFKSFQSKCIEICELDPAYFLSAPGLAWQTYLKKKVELELITDVDRLLIIFDIQYSIDNIINSKNLNNIKIDKKSYKNIRVYYIKFR